jgi:hypothetical protein
MGIDVLLVSYQVRSALFHPPVLHWIYGIDQWSGDLPQQDLIDLVVISIPFLLAFFLVGYR